MVLVKSLHLFQPQFSEIRKKNVPTFHDSCEKMRSCWSSGSTVSETESASIGGVRYIGIGGRHVCGSVLPPARSPGGHYRHRGKVQVSITGTGAAPHARQHEEEKSPRSSKSTTSWKGLLIISLNLDDKPVSKMEQGFNHLTSEGPTT